MKRSNKSKKHAQLLFGAFVVALMVFSVFGFVMSYKSDSQGATLKYNEYTFHTTPQGYNAKINGKTSYFSSFPGDLEDIEIPDSIITPIKNTKMIYLTSDPNSKFFQDIGLVQYQFQNELNNHLGVYGVISIDRNASYQLPVISCDDATEHVPVLYFQQSNETRVTQEDNCILIEAPSQQLFVRLKDRLLFALLGVME